MTEGVYLGCASPQELQRNQEDRTTTWLEPIDEKARLTYVSDCGSNDVTVYDSNARVVGEIGGLDCPLGLFVDHHGDLWVANSGEQDVLEFARSGTTPIKTLTNARAIPNDVTICP